MSKPPVSEAEFRREVTDRLRRLETRITKFMEFLGMDTGVKRPVYSQGELDIPTDATSLRDILAALPPEVTEIRVVHKGTLLVRLTR